MSEWVRSFTESEEARSRVAEQAARKRKWLPDSEYTSAELADQHRRLRADFYEREGRRAA